MVTGADGRCFGSLGVRVGTLPTWPVESMRAGIPSRYSPCRGWLPHRLGLRRTVLPQPDRQDRDQADGPELALRQVVFRTARVSLGWIASNGRGRRNVQM